MMQRSLLMGILLLLAATGVVRAGEPQLVVEGAWARPSLGAGGASAVYFTVRNIGGIDDVLTSVETSAASTAMLHESTMDGTIMKMAMLQSVPIPAGATVKFAPGGKHVMLTGLKAPLTAGQSITLTLVFKNAGTRAIPVPVRDAAPESMEHMPGMPH